MTVIATASNPRFSVSRVDIDRPGETYTIDTLRDLRAERGPEVEFYFITGADALARMISWLDADELFSLAQFVGCTRPGHQLTMTDLPPDRVKLLEIPALAISSTECRMRVRGGHPIWYLVPDGIVQYIAKRGLYAGAGPGPAGVRPRAGRLDDSHHPGRAPVLDVRGPGRPQAAADPVPQEHGHDRRAAVRRAGLAATRGRCCPSRVGYCGQLAAISGPLRIAASMTYHGLVRNIPGQTTRLNDTIR